MNLNELQNVWNSPRNNLPTEAQQQLAGQFARQMIRRRRFQSIWLTNTFVWLTIITVVAIWNIVAGQTAAAQEWGLLPLLIVPWGFAIHFLRRHLKPVPPIARGEMSVAGSFRAALSSNQTEQSHLKLVAALLAIIVPLVAVSMQQLHAAGKVSSRELLSMAVFFSGILLASGAGVAALYFGRVLPQQRRLDALLTEMTGQPQ